MLENMKYSCKKRRKANICGSSHGKIKQIIDSSAELYYCIKTNGRWFQMEARMERGISCLSMAVIFDENAKALNNLLKLFAQLYVKQLVIFQHSVAAASD